ncbi:MAG TPA: cation:proton antiporter [Candidatus Saccharimonadales bacterium]|nr:cation:proton antiporter [Candidatus Saccharimonadales bacterium]
MNPTAIENHLRFVLMDWTIIIAVAWFFGRLGKRLGQPLAVGEIVAGLLLGPSALGLIWPKNWPVLFPSEAQQSLQLLGKLGIILLLFQVGMEFDFGHFRRQSRTVVGVSLMGIIAPVMGGLAIGHWLHDRFAPNVDFLGFQLYVCIALSITALPILGRILLEMKLERTAFGMLAVSAAAIDDVIGWVGLAAVTALVTSKFRWMPMFGQIFGLALFFLLLMKAGGPALRWFWKRSLARVDRSDASKMPSSFLAVLLICLFGCCLITNQLGVFSIFGGFLLGVALHQQNDLVKAWRDQLSNFVMVALVPIFFTNTGLRTEIGSLNSSVALLGCATILLVGAAGKLLGCWAAARLGGQPNRDAICIAALMNARALMGLVAINVGYELGVLPKDLFTMFVIMSLVTTAMTGPLLKWFLPLELRSLVPDYAADNARRARRANRDGKLSHVR